MMNARITSRDFFMQSIFVILGCFCNVISATEYPLSDPRNPKCPCHKHQKRAEREYLSLLKSERAPKKSLPASQTPIASKFYFTDRYFYIKKSRLRANRITYSKHKKNRRIKHFNKAIDACN